jgi:hypothetical protein
LQGGVWSQRADMIWLGRKDLPGAPLRRRG